MERRALAIVCALSMIVPSFLGLPGGSARESGLEAGAGQAEITPPIGTSMWGYTAREGVLATAGDLADGEYPRWLDQRDDGADADLYGKTFLKSEGVHTRLYANAHVLDDGEDQLAIVQVDLGGVPGELHQAVVDRLAAEGVGIERAELTISATHTHGGPGEIFPYQGYALLGGGELDPRVFGLVADQITASIVEAWEDRRPAEIAVGDAELGDATRNRADEAHRVVHDHHEDEPHVDETARLIRVDAMDGEPIGLIVQFAAHGTIVGSEDLLFTGDNQGVATRMVEAGIAERSEAITGADDVVVSLVNGAEGDVSPVGAGASFFERVEDAGERQAGPLLAAWEELAGEGTSDVDLDTRYAFACFCGQEVAYRSWSERLSPVPILGAGGQNPAPANIPGHGNKTPALIGPATVPNVVRLQVAQIGPHVFATMPGEPTMAVGEAIEEAIAQLPGAEGVETVDLVGLANDYISYMTLVPEYEVQEYEGTFTLYGRMTTPMLEARLLDMAEAMFADEPVDPGYEGLVEHPNLPLASADPLCSSAADSQCVPTGAPPEEVLAEPAAQASAGDVVELAWLGGRPGVDHPVDEAMVEVVNADTGEVLVDDTGYTLRVLYEKVDDEHRWSLEWPVGEDTPPGDYEIHVDGQHVAVPGQVADYAYTAGPITVTGVGS